MRHHLLNKTAITITNQQWLQVTALGLSNNGPIHSQAWLEGGLRRPYPLLDYFLLADSGSGDIAPFRCVLIDYPSPPNGYPPLVITQMVRVKLNGVTKPNQKL